MNKKHLGTDAGGTLKEWFKEPGFKARVMENVEKRELAMLLKKIRNKEHLSQSALAKRADVAQSVIARIESSTKAYLPQISLYSRLVRAMGYKLELNAVKERD